MWPQDSQYRALASPNQCGLAKKKEWTYLPSLIYINPSALKWENWRPMSWNHFLLKIPKSTIAPFLVSIFHVCVCVCVYIYIYSLFMILISIYIQLTLFWGCPGGSNESACKCRRHRFGPWVEKIPWGREWQHTPVLLPGKSHRQRSLAGCSPWSHKETDILFLHRKPCFYIK